MFGLKVPFLKARTNCNLENHTRTHELVLLLLRFLSRILISKIVEEQCPYNVAWASNG